MQMGAALAFDAVPAALFGAVQGFVGLLVH
jgi:hypothetical protein